jgi:uncharacterized protein
VEVGYGLEGVLPDGRVGSILDHDVIPFLKRGEPELAYVAGVRALLVPVLEEDGRTAEELDALLRSSGYVPERPPRNTGPRIPWFLILLILLFLLGGRRGGAVFLPWFGGFGGGGFGGGGGGFGGFGGGLSGGGGAGRGY